MAKVSVVVPSFNHARFLARRLDSIVEQTYRDVEIILLDDASEDGSAEICARFAERHPCRFIRNEVNSGGAFSQWNKGIRAAAGEYVWIAESDDFADARFLETLVDRLDQNPGCGLAYCRSLRVDETGKVLGPALPTMKDIDLTRWERDFVNDGRQECARFLIRENIIYNASAVVFRRKLYDQVGGVDDTLRLSSDWKFWASLLRISDIAYIAAPLNYFRTHRESVRSTSRTWLELAEAYQVMEYILNSVDVPRESLEDLHTRAVVLFMHAILVERPSVTDVRRARKLAARLRFRFSLRTSADIVKQTLQALGRELSRLTGPAASTCW